MMLVTTSGVTEEDRGVNLTKPPSSIEQWYKPANKRQVWLHTMFRLRREMQAMGEYAAYKDQPRLLDWSEKFVKDYKSIGTMVPEWKDELENEWADRLLIAAKAGDFEGVGAAQRKIGKSCGGCHKEYRAVTAVLHRGPNFSEVMIEDGETMEERSFKQSMEGLSTAMNRIKIAITDNRFDVATKSHELMSQRLEDLSGSCGACHQTDRQKDYLMGEKNMAKVQNLGELIEAKDVKEAQKSLGSVAVEICATCHSIHRTLADLREFIDK
ncbi:MAG: cytochrome c [Gammaproteobacteria bacterium]|nr:cytochrome c [Gammaproteobacteria bacterium]